MMDSSEERRQLAIAAAQQALGALHHVSPTQMVAEVGGRRVEIVLGSAQVHMRQGGRSVPNRVLELRVPLAVLSKFGIEARSIYVHVGPVPIVTTGIPDSTPCTLSPASRARSSTERLMDRRALGYSSVVSI
jgi:hypothetical protein